MSAGKPTVLVLDDDRLTLELYTRELNGEFHIITSESVLETRLYLKKNDFDALIIEPEVNNGEGWNLLEEIHANPNSPPVVLCSVDDDRKTGMGQGAFAFLVKPVLPSILHALLNQLILKKCSKLP